MFTVHSGFRFFFFIFFFHFSILIVFCFIFRFLWRKRERKRLNGAWFECSAIYTIYMVRTNISLSCFMILPVIVLFNLNFLLENLFCLYHPFIYIVFSFWNFCLFFSVALFPSFSNQIAPNEFNFCHASAFYTFWARENI